MHLEIARKITEIIVCNCLVSVRNFGGAFLTITFELFLIMLDSLSYELRERTM